MKLIIILLFALVANCDLCSAPIDGPGCFSISTLAYNIGVELATGFFNNVGNVLPTSPRESVSHITSGHIYTIENYHFHKFLSFGNNGAVESSANPTKF